MRIYDKLSYNELRKLVINGEIAHKKLRLPLYEGLLDNEAGLEKPSAVVLEFCVIGMKRFRKYKKKEDAVVLTNAVANRLRKERSPQKAEKNIFVIPRKRRLIFAAIIVVLAVVLVGCATFFDFIREILGLPERTPTNLRDGNEAIRVDGERLYNSMTEMLEIENLNILYPAMLPEGYAFTNFEVIDFGMDLEIRAYTAEPYILFTVRIGADYHIEEHEFEINGIKYNIFDMEDGLYQAYWRNNDVSYVIVVDNKTVISEIIENLKES